MNQQRTHQNAVRVFASHSIEFATAHFYRQALWSDETNKKEFGPCARPYGHGHNYKLHVTFEVAAPEKNLTEKFDAILQQAVREFDHHHISFEHPVFSGPKALIPTTENIALHLMQQLTSAASTTPELRRDLAVIGLSLYEDDTISVEIGLSKRELFDRIARPTSEARITLKTGEAFQVRVDTKQKSYVAEKARNSNSLTELSLALIDGSDAVLMTTRSGHFFFAGFFEGFKAAGASGAAGAGYE